jgi:hypothetical protein
LYVGGAVVGLGFVVVLTGVGIYSLARPLWEQRAIPALALVVAPLTVSWALFGLGGLIATGYPLEDRPSQVGVAYTNVAVLEMALLVLVASVVYALAFRWTSGRMFYAPIRVATHIRWEGWALALLVLLLFVLDLYARWSAIQEGAYFAWFGTEEAERYRATSGLQHAQPTLAALAAGPLSFSIPRCQGRQRARVTPARCLRGDSRF